MVSLWMFAGCGTSSTPIVVPAAVSWTTAAPSTVSPVVQDVTQHATSSDCRVSINGNTYNLTPYINKHPWWADKITYLCGKDGTQAFDGQHWANPAILQLLSQYIIK